MLIKEKMDNQKIDYENDKKIQSEEMKTIHTKLDSIVNILADNQ